MAKIQVLQEPKQARFALSLTSLFYGNFFALFQYLRRI
tara:strand:+ start:32307 stop:32420 length:114 start_codon:yes stop_codon:yes gene_type:complete